MDILFLCLMLLMGWFAWTVLRRSSRNLKVKGSPYPPDSVSKSGADLQGDPAEHVSVPEPHSSLFTSEDELNAFKAGQPIWIRYEDTSGTITERVVEIYRPRDDEVIYTWCRRKQAPRTFVRRNIRSWRLLEERFDFDPVVARYWDEEGTRDRSEKSPWRRWLRRQPKEITDRYS